MIYRTNTWPVLRLAIRSKANIQVILAELWAGKATDALYAPRVNDARHIGNMNAGFLHLSTSTSATMRTQSSPSHSCSTSFSCSLAW